MEFGLGFQVSGFEFARMAVTPLCCFAVSGPAVGNKDPQILEFEDANHKKWRQQSQFDGDADEDGVGGKDVWLDTDAAIADQMTWIGINVVYDIGVECEHIGRWAEACGCPEHQPHSDSIVSASHAAQTSKHQPNPKAGQAKTSRRSKTSLPADRQGIQSEVVPIQRLQSSGARSRPSHERPAWSSDEQSFRNPEACKSGPTSAFRPN